MTTHQELPDSVEPPIDVSRVCISMDAPWDARNEQLIDILRSSAERPSHAEAQVRQLLEQGININARDGNRWGALRLAEYFHAPMRIRDMLAYASREGTLPAVIPAATSLAVPVATERVLDIEFRGSARGYFRIWAVNLCLTLLTLGIFSAWAKVRKKRYFYSHTLLDHTPFQYLGEPLPILKGRIVAVVLFLLWYLSINFFVTVMPVLIAIAAVLAPWVLARSAAFNARYSAFRNLRFNFSGTYWDAVRTLYAWGLIPLILIGAFILWQWQQPVLFVIAAVVFGVYLPFWLAGIKRFLVDHTRFGGMAGKLAITGGNFYFIYFKAGLIASGLMIITGAVAFGITQLAHGWALGNAIATFALVLPYVGYVVVYAYIQARIGNLVWNNMRLGPLRFQSTLATRRLAELYLSNGLAILVSFGLLIPWAVVRSFRYRAQCLQGHLQGEWSDFGGGEASSAHAAGAEVSEMFDLDFSL